MSLKDKFTESFATFQQGEHKILLWLTILTGVAFLIPQSDFQYFISQGDHGLDLYCFKETMHGAWPYRDYFWFRGPLMPYYYALIFKILGTTIQSAVLGLNFLTLVNGILFYLIGSTFLSPLFAFGCALSYWAMRGPEFFYTYAHAGGISSMLLTVFFLLKYLKQRRLVFAYAGSLSLLALLLIRVNIGLILLSVFFLSLAAIDGFTRHPLRQDRISLYCLLSLIIISLTSLIYATLLHSLPIYAIQQSLPYFKSSRTDDTLTSIQAFLSLKKALVPMWARAVGEKGPPPILLIAPFFIQAIFVLAGKSLSRQVKINILFTLGVLLVIMIANLHEFILSGNAYRLPWALPLVYLLIFSLFDISTRPKVLRWPRVLFIIIILGTAWLKMMGENLAISSLRKPQHLLNINGNHLYSLQSQKWLNVVTSTVRYLDQNLSPHEKFLALPYEPIYYFLTGRESPTRQLILFEHTHIPPEQEKLIIHDLILQKVSYIVLSNRAFSPSEYGMGVLGKDYCPLLAKYIETNYQTVATFGTWTQMAGWNEGHAIKIFKKI